MKRTMLICLVVCIASIAATAQFTTPKARQAVTSYDSDLAKAKDRYLAALKEAQDAAFQAKDREEVNRIQAEMDRLRKPEAHSAPYAGKSFLSPKYGEITFREDGIYLSSDQKPETARWYRVDEDRALVWTQEGWATLFVIEKGGAAATAYSVGQVSKQPAWVAPAVQKKQ